MRAYLQANVGTGGRRWMRRPKSVLHYKQKQASFDKNRKNFAKGEISPFKNLIHKEKAKCFGLFF
jgi:hypothetical protein